MKKIITIFLMVTLFVSMFYLVGAIENEISEVKGDSKAYLKIGECEGVSMPEYCPEEGDEFWLDEGEFFGVKGEYAVIVTSLDRVICGRGADELNGVSCEPIGIVNLLIDNVCTGEVCDTSIGEGIEIKEGESIEIKDSGIFIKLVSTISPDGKQIARFVYSERFIYIEPNCPVSCICDEEIIKCTNEQQPEIGTSIPDGEGASSEIAMGKTGSGSSYFKKGDVKVVSKNDIKVSNSKLIVNTEDGEKEIKVMPDRASEIAIEKLGELDFIIELKETGNYELKGERNSKLFFIIPVKEKYSIEIDSETGEVIGESKPWWGFLAKDSD